MISIILFIWIGMQLNPPAWYYWLCGLGIFIKLINFGVNMYKAGSKK